MQRRLRTTRLLLAYEEPMADPQDMDLQSGDEAAPSRPVQRSMPAIPKNRKRKRRKESVKLGSETQEDKKQRRRRRVKARLRKKNRVSQGSGPAAPGRDENPVVDTLCELLANGSLMTTIVGRDGQGKNDDVTRTDVAMFANNAVQVLTEVAAVIHSQGGLADGYTLFKDLYVSYARRFNDKRRGKTPLKTQYPHASKLPKAKTDTKRAAAVLNRLREAAGEWISCLYQYSGFLFHAPVVTDGADKLNLGHVVFLGACFLVHISGFVPHLCGLTVRPFPAIEALEGVLSQNLFLDIKPFSRWILGDVVEAYQYLNATYLDVQFNDDVEEYLGVLRRLVADYICTEGPKELYECPFVLGGVVLSHREKAFNETPMYAVSQDGVAYFATQVMTFDFRAATALAFSQHTPESFLWWLQCNRERFKRPSESNYDLGFDHGGPEDESKIHVPTMSPLSHDWDVQIVLGAMMDEMERGEDLTAVPLYDNEITLDPGDVCLYRELSRTEDFEERVKAYVDEDNGDLDTVRNRARDKRVYGILDRYGNYEESTEAKAVYQASAYTRFLVMFMDAIHGSGSSSFGMWLRSFRQTVGRVLLAQPFAREWLHRLRSTKAGWRGVLGFQQSSTEQQAVEEMYVSPNFAKLILCNAVHPFRNCNCDGKMAEALQLFMFASFLQAEVAKLARNADETFAFLDFVVLENELPDQLDAMLVRPEPTVPVIVQMWGKWNVFFAGQCVPFVHIKHALFFWLFVVWRYTNGVVRNKYDLTAVLESLFSPTHEDKEESVANSEETVRSMLLQFIGAENA